jgi:aspartate/methionine/tyrosine aminotransferase
LCENLAKYYSKQFGRELNPMTEILPATGGVNALFSFTMGLVNDGDEVVLLEPGFPMFLDHLKLAKAVVKSVPLEYKPELETWKINFDALR